MDWVNPPAASAPANNSSKPVEDSANMSVAPPTKEQDIQPPASPTGVWDFLFTPFLNSDDDNQNNNNNKADLDDNNSVDTGCFSILSQGNLAPVPERLVDYFCVVGPDLKKVESVAAKPSDLALNAKLMDCYPPNRTDLAFPNELPMFCLPNGCQLSTYKVAPTISTVVLTSSSGNRIYGSVLTMYEEVPLADLCSAFWKGECSLPRWLEEPQPFYLPKCLVVISHHAFFHVQTTFLSQLYRIAMSGRSPLPLERYIANFVNDIPLPRPEQRVLHGNALPTIRLWNLDVHLPMIYHLSISPIGPCFML